MAKKIALDTSFPAGATKAEPGELRIAIDRSPYAEIMSHARESTEVEVCGVLVGRASEDEAGLFIHITHVIRGEGASHKGNQVTFTHDTWSHINRVMDAEHASRQMVGWYHTHPDYGIFLSEMDQFIHTNFFTEPFHVAYVYDPLAGTEGFFTNREGKLVPAERYFMGPKERRIVMKASKDLVPERGAEDRAISARLDSLEALLTTRAPDRPMQAYLPWMTTAILAALLVAQTTVGACRRDQLSVPLLVDPVSGEIYRLEPTGRSYDQIRREVDRELEHRLKTIRPVERLPAYTPTPRPTEPAPSTTEQPSEDDKSSP